MFRFKDKIKEKIIKSSARDEIKVDPEFLSNYAYPIVKQAVVVAFAQAYNKYIAPYKEGYRLGSDVLNTRVEMSIDKNKDQVIAIIKDILSTVMLGPESDTSSSSDTKSEQGSSTVDNSDAERSMNQKMKRNEPRRKQNENVSGGPTNSSVPSPSGGKSYINSGG